MLTGQRGRVVVAGKCATTVQNGAQAAGFVAARDDLLGDDAVAVADDDDKS